MTPIASCRATLILFHLVASFASAASFSTGLSKEEVGRIIREFGTGSMVRPLRSAEALPSWPGLKAGIELTLQPTRDLNQLGSRNGTLPTFFPMPRFYIAKGLGEDAEIVLGTFPFVMINTVATYGALVKWTVRPEDENWLATAVYAGYTRMLALNNSLRAHTFETGISISKDYVRLRPYLGVAFSLSAGDIDPFYSPGADGGTVTSFKLFAGFELEFPMSLSVQLDFIDVIPSASMLVGLRL
jgi:hypothetical protein